VVDMQHCQGWKSVLSHWCTRPKCKRHNEIGGPFGIGGSSDPQEPPSYEPGSFSFWALRNRPTQNDVGRHLWVMSLFGSWAFICPQILIIIIILKVIHSDSAERKTNLKSEMTPLTNFRAIKRNHLLIYCASMRSLFTDDVTWNSWAKVV